MSIFGNFLKGNRGWFVGVFAIILSQLGFITQMIVFIALILSAFGIYLSKKTSSKFGILINVISLLLSILNIMYLNTIIT